MKTLITAHSGADGFADNSLAFVDYALHSGADAVEVDVRRGAAGITTRTLRAALALRDGTAGGSAEK